MLCTVPFYKSRGVSLSVLHEHSAWAPWSLKDFAAPCSIAFHDQFGCKEAKKTLDECACSCKFKKQHCTELKQETEPGDHEKDIITILYAYIPCRSWIQLRQEQAPHYTAASQSCGSNALHTCKELAWETCTSPPEIPQRIQHEDLTMIGRWQFVKNAQMQRWSELRSLWQFKKILTSIWTPHDAQIQLGAYNLPA